MDYTSARDLIEECARGPEPRAWGRFVDRFGPVIESGVRRALRRVGEPGMAAAELQDLVQDCYCRLLERGCRRLAGLRATADPEVRAWLERFAERSTRDRLRWKRASKRRGRPSVPLVVPGRNGRLTDPFGSPERLAIGRQALRQFARHCRRLSASERDARILRLVYFAGLTSREVAAMSGGTVSPGSVDSMVYRFRRRLAGKGLPVPARAPVGSGRRRRRPARKRSTRPAARAGLESSP
jgi:RNA polymerase sigma factor (sigma-70 family)